MNRKTFDHFLISEEKIVKFFILIEFTENQYLFKIHMFSNRRPIIFSIIFGKIVPSSSKM